MNGIRREYTTLDILSCLLHVGQIAKHARYIQYHNKSGF